MMTKPRVLLIDDNLDHLQILTVALQSNYDVLTATDGLDGYATAKAVDITVIVLDISMPVVDGWTVLQKLRTNVSTRHIPVVILTGIELEAVTPRARELGVEAVLRKPTDLKMMGRQVARLIARSAAE